ncbi:MAG: alpha/beta hydrolase [SAR202 cluster bacterium]|jgi:pimeloyl-ACP methyl ester carboxylesterase|nr:hypothetical protein [Chloroflexota bacterium]MQG81215.1 alpha/beta hydrolase [SAR202 cluster bacterium]|tara:strand:+ start:10241 stop:10984 length:744 start_codon:yes stop_codon:yes gene_type:complete
MTLPDLGVDVMSQFVFIHGPGAGSCSDSFCNQLDYFEGSLAPDLPGHPVGAPCEDVDSYANWLRGWLWGSGVTEDLVLCGFTLGACIALQYALEFPEEVKALVLMTISMRAKERPPASLQFRLDAASDQEVYQQWKDAMAHSMMFMDPDLRRHLLSRHDAIGPIAQYKDLVTIDKFDVSDRINDLKTPLLLIRGVDDPGKPPEYELEINKAVPGSQYLKLDNAGHFPMAERPEVVNSAIEQFLANIK